MRIRRLVLALALASSGMTAVARADAIVEGRRAWLKLNCYGCHGANARGGMGPNVQRADYYSVIAGIYGSGRGGGMRDFIGIATATDAANIAAYLASIGTPTEPKWFDWWKAH